MKKNIVLIPNEKSNDVRYMKNILDEICQETQIGSHVCCSGDSLEFRIEEHQHIAMTSKSNDEVIFKVDDTGKIVRL